MKLISKENLLNILVTEGGMNGLQNMMRQMQQGGGMPGMGNLGKMFGGGPP